MTTTRDPSASASSDSVRRARRSLMRFGQIVLDRLTYAYSLLLVIAAWEIAARSGLTHPVFLPPFSTVVRQIGHLVQQGELFEPLAISLYRAFAGLVLATVIGTLIGIGMARSRWLHWLFDPFVSLGFPSPKIAFVPVFVLWFGIDSLSKVLLVTFACVFPITIAIYHGAKEISRVIIWSALAMGTSRLGMVRRIMLPACLPHLFSAIRIAVPVALITTFTAEMVSGGGGVGDNLMYAQRLFDTSTVFVYIIAMLMTGLVFDSAILTARRRLLRWLSDAG